MKPGTLKKKREIENLIIMAAAKILNLRMKMLTRVQKHCENNTKVYHLYLYSIFSHFSFILYDLDENINMEDKKHSRKDKDNKDKCGKFFKTKKFLIFKKVNSKFKKIIEFKAHDNSIEIIDFASVLASQKETKPGNFILNNLYLNQNEEDFRF